MQNQYIQVLNATQNNLKNISINLPKYAITVFCGVSGSGKSSLVLDTIAAQSRRELNDTFPTFVQHYLPKYGRPQVGQIRNLPTAIVIDQKKPTPNQRSTLGTYTDIYTLVRLLFSRVGKPFVGYSDTFSFNHPSGCCPTCNGLGEVTQIDVHKLVDFDKCLNDTGVIHYVAFEPGQWRWIRYANSSLFDLDKKIRDYTPEELELFLYSPPIKLKNPPPGWPKTAKYEGLVHRMYRSVVNSEEGKLHRELLAPMTHTGTCPTCHGARLNQKVLGCTIQGKNITDVCAMPLQQLLQWVQGLTDPLAVDIQHTLTGRIQAMVDIGLGYLALNRPLGTLSGGEAQRCKIAKCLTSSLSDLLYILDEPSVGLHPHDIAHMKQAVQRLRDSGNTVLLVEHHTEMLGIADYIVELGPGAGTAGGEVLFFGTFDQLQTANTPTGRALRQSGRLKTACRTPAATFALQNVCLHNLQNISLQLPMGVLCGIAGVAGSGKSSLMQAFCQSYPGHATYINQKNIGASLRSTPATYLGIADRIRHIFAARCHQKASLFSFNGEGKCPVCGGKGVVVSDMSFMDSIETVCEACQGLRYAPNVLQYTIKGKNIATVMDLSVQQAATWFDDKQIQQALQPLQAVGLGYLHLNQALSTLSGGELQRLKLASHLQDTGEALILDEPTDGLHWQDVEKLLQLLNQMVDAGNTVFVIEHNLQILQQTDYIVELGPGGGVSGGRVLFCGTPAQMLHCPQSVTAPYLAAAVAPAGQTPGR